MPSARYLQLEREAFAEQDALAQWLSSNKDADGTYHVDPAEAERRESALNAKFAQLKDLGRLEEMELRHSREADEHNQLVDRHIHASSGGAYRSTGAPKGVSHKSLGEQVGDALLKHQRSGRKELNQEFSLDVRGWLEAPELKAAFLTTAGWLPESRRTGQIVDRIAAPIEILDVFPFRQTETPTPVYMEETLRTSAAQETAEGGAYQESALALTPRTVNVRKIATSLPASDEQLADVAEAAAYIDSRLRYFCRRRLESQLLLGDGIAPNVLGILNTSGVQTQPIGADTRLDAIYKGINKVRTVGMASPTYILVHPDDFLDIRLTKDTANNYLWGAPSISGPATIWGLPAVLTTILTPGTALVGDFTFSQAYLRADVQVEVGWVGTQFTSGLQTIRAQLRCGFAVLRAEAFCTVSGI